VAERWVESPIYLGEYRSLRDRDWT
jgi:hypothetical protein